MIFTINRLRRAFSHLICYYVRNFDIRKHRVRSLYYRTDVIESAFIIHHGVNCFRRISWRLKSQNPARSATSEYETLILIGGVVRTEDRRTLFTILMRVVLKDVLPKSAALTLSEERGTLVWTHGHQSVSPLRPSREGNLTGDLFFNPWNQLTPVIIPAAMRSSQRTPTKTTVETTQGEAIPKPGIYQIIYSYECDFYYIVDRLTMLWE